MILNKTKYIDLNFIPVWNVSELYVLIFCYSYFSLQNKFTKLYAVENIIFL